MRETANVIAPRGGGIRFGTAVLRNRPAMLVIAGYTFHSWEVLGMWAWAPAFLAACFNGDGIRPDARGGSRRERERAASRDRDCRRARSGRARGSTRAHHRDARDGHREHRLFPGLRVAAPHAGRVGHGGRPTLQLHRARRLTGLFHRDHRGRGARLPRVRPGPAVDHGLRRRRDRAARVRSNPRLVRGAYCRSVGLVVRKPGDPGAGAGASVIALHAAPEAAVLRRQPVSQSTGVSVSAQ